MGKSGKGACGLDLVEAVEDVLLHTCPGIFGAELTGNALSYAMLSVGAWF